MRKNTNKIFLLLLLVFMLSMSMGYLYVNPSKPSDFFITFPENASNQDWWWEPIELLSSEFTSDNLLSKIAVDNDNNIHVVTYSSQALLSSGSDHDIFYKKFDYATQTWSDLELVSLDSTAMSQYPDIEVDSVGNVHVVWYDTTNYNSSGTDADVIYRQRTNSGWGSIEVISTESSGSSYAPSIAIDSRNSVHVAWADQSALIFYGTDSDIFYKNRNSSGTWTTSYVVSFESSNPSTLPQITLDDEDNRLFVWVDEENFESCGTDKDIFFKKLDFGSTTFSPLSVVSSESDLDSDEPSISTECGGDIHVCWTDDSDYDNAGLDEDIFYKKYDLASESWSLTEVISHESTDSSWQCAVAADNDDYLYVTWRDGTDIGGIGNEDNIYVKYHDLSTNIWSSYFVLTFDHDDWAGAPEVDVDTFGHVHVIWVDDTDDLLDSGTDSDLIYRKFVGKPGVPVLDVITPNPASAGKFSLSWSPVRDAQIYYIYRESSYFTTVSGLTPIEGTSSKSFIDNEVPSGLYYYAIVAENEYGQSICSNVEAVTITGLFSSINLVEIIIISAIFIIVQLIFSLLFRGKKKKSKRK